MKDMNKTKEQIKEIVKKEPKYGAYGVTPSKHTVREVLDSCYWQIIDDENEVDGKLHITSTINGMEKTIDLKDIRPYLQSQSGEGGVREFERGYRIGWYEGITTETRDMEKDIKKHLYLQSQSGEDLKDFARWFNDRYTIHAESPYIPDDAVQEYLDKPTKPSKEMGYYVDCGHPDIRLYNNGYNLPCFLAPKHQHFICYKHHELGCPVCEPQPTKPSKEDK